MVVLQKAPMGAVCNTLVLYKVATCLYICIHHYSSTKLSSLYKFYFIEVLLYSRYLDYNRICHWLIGPTNTLKL